jgi:hypothetical protein
VEVHLAGGAMGHAIAPAGASTGSGEALDHRDGGTAFGGFDTRRALATVESDIAAALKGRDATDQVAIDATLLVTNFLRVRPSVNSRSESSPAFRPSSRRCPLRTTFVLAHLIQELCSSDALTWPKGLIAGLEHEGLPI